MKVEVLEMDKLDFLIQYLLKERNEKVNLQELSVEDKKKLFRSLCNVRDAKEISKQFLSMQDEYLQEELKAKGIVDNIEDSKIQDKIYLWKGDITTLKVDAIVNAANLQGLGCFVPCHKCIDNSIHSSRWIAVKIRM